MDTYSFIEGYIAAALIFWVINALIEFAFSKIELKLKKSKNVNNRGKKYV